VEREKKVKKKRVKVPGVSPVDSTPSQNKKSKISHNSSGIGVSAVKKIKTKKRRQTE